ncbi:hypothetical protein C0J52_13741 [Blattella germanica]|nr:hypothetical protein C0J52_13741 [Blattella germanica]
MRKLRETFVWGPPKPIRRASQELNIPKSTHRVSLRWNFQHYVPCNKTILKWYRQFVEQGCICDKRKAHSGKRPLNAQIAGDICMGSSKTYPSS